MCDNSVFISDKQALWLGRFQPPSVGHLTAVLAILARWKLLTIGVVHYSKNTGKIDSKWKAYIDNNTQSVIQSLARNPFQPEEVITMFKAILDKQKISHRVKFISISQVAYQRSFNFIYPPNKYDFIDVALTPHDPETDYIRQKSFRDFLDRPIEYIMTPWKIHISKIRDQVNKGIISWDEYIPPGGYEYFLNIDGPTRMGFYNSNNK